MGGVEAIERDIRCCRWGSEGGRKVEEQPSATWDKLGYADVLGGSSLQFWV